MHGDKPAHLRDTSFGIAFERCSGGYSVEMKYRDATPPRILASDVSAAEAAAVIEGVVAGATAVKAAGATKPEYITIDTFLRQSGERCIKCQSKDIVAAHLATGNGSITQICSCSRCDVAWDSIASIRLITSTRVQSILNHKSKEAGYG